MARKISMGAVDGIYKNILFCLIMVCAGSVIFDLITVYVIITVVIIIYIMLVDLGICWFGLKAKK
jgi:hypothetical protein